MIKIVNDNRKKTKSNLLKSSKMLSKNLNIYHINTEFSRTDLICRVYSFRIYDEKNVNKSIIYQNL